MGAGVIFALITTACGRADDSLATAAPVVMRDSSGIAIVESAEPRWGLGEGWQVGSAPSVSVGPESADSAHLIWKVRGAARLSDGRIAVLSGGPRKVIIFDREAEFVRAMGGVGEGPGEFTSPRHLRRRAGDTLVVWEFNYGPRTFFDTTGAVLDSRPIDRARVLEALGPELSTENVTPLPDGSFVAHVSPAPSQQPKPAADQAFRSRLGYALIDRDYTARVLGAVGRYRGLEVIYREESGSLIPVVREFPPRASIAAGGPQSRIYVSDGADYQIDVFDPSGELIGMIRRDTPPVPITSQERRLARESLIGWNAMTERERDRWLRTLELLPRRESYPAINDLFVDRQGYVWMRNEGEGWSVFNPSGHWLGRVDVPLVRLYDVGSDFILGWTFDEFQRERVEEYPLDRAPSTSRSGSAS